ncbi:hypothetical protein FF38_12962 [Lucilia cuprina]|uniref:protein disulfide-isomerase n=1 Tax=Lucilia cuprina TaxID=7375 RepID=A0A0L0BZU9_LUCCU|nr:Protein disulfide isomerase-like 1-1 [Lucilia cuprina]KAI8129616.1 Protein disulfide isomerase-like 1-1 [Lucilia cuprina]KNC25538.1 hypothetical protein FF38_12962 [Lucilia cuprina]
MESENVEDIIKSINQIDIEDEPGTEKYISNPWAVNYKPQATLRYIPLKYIDFEEYVKENCHNKIKILNREIFHEIKRPIVIFFNHFREKCAYHTKWLDEMYKLSLKYGDRIEFIAADMIDIDVIFPGRNPLNFYCRLVRPEDESPNTYAIDEKKRIHTHYDAYYNMDNLWSLCEELLSGKLFPSLPIPENNDTNLVKICVHDNYEELILKSSRNIFLIANLDRYHFSEYEPNYDNIALALKDYNLDIVYMEAEKNYIPFEYQVNSYPTILFIPHNDKNNFIYYEDFRKEDVIIEFLKNVMDDPEFLLLKQQELKTRILRKTMKVADDFQIDFMDLPQFLQENFDNRYKVFERKILEDPKRFYIRILIFMDFPNMKCLSHHIQWLDKIYQVVERAYSFQFFIADFKDIDVINSQWKAEDLIKSAQGKPKIYAFDHLWHTYEFKDFTSIPSLFYFTSSLQSRHFYYSQVYPRKNIHQLVKEWTADYFNIFLKKTKKHTFITFYLSDDENTEKLLNLLDIIAEDVKALNVEVVKFDAHLNYVDLEYAQERYPVQYFISKHNKRDSRIYRGNDLSRDKILEFIKSQVEKK